MNTQATETTGKLELAPNPCSTKLCLPGMAFAVVANGVPYFLTRHGRFYMQNETDLPSPGGTFVVVGMVRDQKDVNGNVFKTVELTSLRPQ